MTQLWKLPAGAVAVAVDDGEEVEDVAALLVWLAWLLWLTWLAWLAWLVCRTTGAVAVRADWWC
jgi:hypothetical protein